MIHLPVIKTKVLSLCRLHVVVLFLVLALSHATQGAVSLTPTITPSFFRYNDQITVSYDVTGTQLAGLTDAYIWIWIPGTTTINGKYNINPASNSASTANAKFQKSGNVFSITFKPSDFFSEDISTKTQLGILLKANDWNSGQTTDFFATVWDGNFSVNIVSPATKPYFVNNGDAINIHAQSSVTAQFDLYVNNSLINTQSGITDFSYSHTVTETSGSGLVQIVATQGAASDTASFIYIIRTASVDAARPPGIVDGINYNTDQTKVTIGLWAPGKTSVYLSGDFSDWEVLPEYQMKKDGEHFWLEISGLTSGVEYAYQFLVDEKLWLADPYADKILDPDDKNIPATSYPNLKQYPAKAIRDQWYFNRLAVFQTGQPAYSWQNANYQRPAKEKLVVYELLIRDFFDSSSRNYQSLIDTLGYFKKLGINAIELMPITEYSGNESWGYEPTFMFAPDKYYGTKTKLKEFVDKCHGLNIAVILDIVMNHHDAPNPYVLMDFDFNAFRPTVNNKWFNPIATHPYNVFFDMNHESSYTKAYLDTVNHYWLNEFKIDGFRYDLSKGFTQNTKCGASQTNESCFAQYDASRVAILKRMADKIWSYAPDAYVILEHFADNSEETELSGYRADEGKGMMLWGNLNYNYSQNSSGYADGSDVSWVYHGTRGWAAPRVVGYMESHDEERVMYRNLQHGNFLGDYHIKDLSVALSRMNATNLFFYSVPGPKMLWEFGELGYDISINDGGRTYPKPVKWDYLLDYRRKALFNFVSDLLRMRKWYKGFTEGSATFINGNSLTKQLTIKNVPYTSTPIDSTQMNVQIAANFDVADQTMTINFPHTGTWYDYYGKSAPINVTSAFSVKLSPGNYKMYTDVPVKASPLVTGINESIGVVINLYPNPVQNQLHIESDKHIYNVQLRSMTGSAIAPPRIDETTWDLNLLTSGLYIVEINSEEGIIRKKVIKK